MNRALCLLFAAIVAVTQVEVAQAQQPPWFPGFFNDWDGPLAVICQGNCAFNGVYSIHHNHYEDRRWSFRGALVNPYDTIMKYYNVNNWDARLYFVCPSQYSMNYLSSYHDNRKEDRIWSFWCGRHAAPSFVSQSCYWTGYLNNWDGELSWSGALGETVAGFDSYHDNGKEDRRWSIYVCRSICTSPYYLSGAACVCPYGYYVTGQSCIKWSQCGAGTYYTDGSSTRNSVCYLCSAGTYQDSTSHISTSCKICNAGTYSSSAGASTCTACPATQFQDQTHATNCKTCATGYYRASASAQAVCPLGHYCPGSCSLQACPPGTFQNQLQQTACKACPSNQYQDQTGTSGCKGCAGGYYRSSATAQTLCPAGYACTGCAATLCTGSTFQDQTGQTSCKSATLCGAGQYEIEPPSSTRNRRCGSCSLFVNFQDATSHSFSSCKGLSVCGVGTFVSTNPTLSTNRFCTSCVSGKFSVTANAASCSDWGVCGHGEYMSRPGTTSSDITCAKCVLGLTYQDSSNHRQASCKTLTPVCPAGSYQYRAPTLSADRICQACPAGTFSERPDTSSCKAHTQCAVGFEQATAPTATSDRVCRQCDGITKYQDTNAQLTCKTVSPCGNDQTQVSAPTPSSNRICHACTTCTASQVQIVACTATTDRVCAACHASCATCSGTGENNCLTCVGTKQLNNGRCTDQCPLNFYTTADGCAPCHSSCTLCRGPTASDCTACSGQLYLDGSVCRSTCPAGKRQVQATNDNQCVDCQLCAAGKYASGGCTGTQNTVCTDVRMCSAGQYESSAPTASQNRLCSACPTGRYQDQVSHSFNFCKTVSTCLPGTRITTESTESTDRVCSPCQAGEFSPVTNAATCTPCSAGTYSDVAGSSGCHECGVGFYAGVRQTKCTAIAAGSYGVGGSVETRTGVAACPAGSYCLGGGNPPQSCEVGKFQDQMGQTSCKNVKVCQPGEAVVTAPTTSTDRVCSACKTGTFQSNGACVAYTVCSAGQEQTQAPTASSDRVCSACAAGKFKAQSGDGSCQSWTTCTPGSEVDLVGTATRDRTCLPCLAGATFQDQTNAETCKPCKVCDSGSFQSLAPTLSTDRVCTSCDGRSQYQDQAGQTSCKPVSLCGAGYYMSGEPTAVSDRTCSPCGTGTYQDVKAHASAECKEQIGCGPGFAEVKPPSSTADAVCTPCIAGQTYSDSFADKVCQPVSTCGQGEYEETAPTTFADRKCRACPANTYMDLTSHTERTCKPLTTCLVGQFQLLAPTKLSNRECEDCDGVSFYQDAAGQISCKPVTTCESGKYETRAPSSKTNRECGTCTTMADCTTNEFLLGTCTNSTNPRCALCHPTCNGCQGAGANECVACAGTGVLHHPLASSPIGTCVDTCPVGQYRATNRCQPCHSSCKECFGADSSSCSACSGDLSLSQGQCVATCPDGTFAKNNVCNLCSICTGHTFTATACTRLSDTVCQDWRLCGVGEEEDQVPTSMRDRTCKPCSVPNFFQPVASQRDCLQTTTCFYPNMESVAPTVSSDRICTCDRLMCSRLVRQVYEDLLCGEPTVKQMDDGVADCCRGSTDVALRAMVMASDEFKARHNCPGCTDTCLCTAGYRLKTIDNLQVCEACDGVTGFAAQPGASLCEIVRTCGRGEQQRVAPTPVSDRVCELCPAGTIDNDNSGTTPCVPCSSGVYTLPGASGSCTTYRCSAGSADDDEDASTPCTACTLSLEYQDEVGRTSCKAVTTCAAGTEEVIPPTRLQNRVCMACQPGKFKAEAGNDARCRLVRDCAIGEEEASAPTPTSDRVCRACVEGVTYKSVAGQDVSCAPVRQCLAGEEELRGPTVLSDRQCSSCILHVSYKPAAGQATRCQRVVPCHPTEYESVPATLTSDSICTVATTCTDTSYESVAPTLTSDRICSPCSACPDGRFAVRPCSAVQDTQCSGCSACEPGKYQHNVCTASSDTLCVTCSTCDANSYQTSPCRADANVACLPQPVCESGTYQVIPPTGFSPRQCKALTTCTAGFYIQTPSTATTDRVCAPYTVCRRGEEEAVKPGAESDRVCQLCPAGTTDADEAGHTPCVPCLPGSFVPLGSAAPCNSFRCPAGTADVDSLPSTPCQPCTLGLSYQPLAAATHCINVTTCAAGFQELLAPTLFADRLCVPCVLGRSFKAEAGSATTCTSVRLCALNEYEQTPPTLSSDRVCVVGKVCGDGEYEVSPLTPLANRVCLPVTMCKSNEFQQTAPTPTSNRVCKAVSICDETAQYMAADSTPTSDRICRFFTVCRADEVETRPPTATSDRICNPTYLQSLYFGTANFDTLASTDALAANWTRDVTAVLASQGLNVVSIVNMTHTAGSIVTEVLSISETFVAGLFELLLRGSIKVLGHVALPCMGRGYIANPEVQNPLQALICTSYRTCESYQYEIRPPSATSDRDCHVIRTCDLDQYEAVPPTPTSDRVCGTKNASSGAAQASTSIVIALMVIIILVAAIGFVVWRRRKVTKDRRQRELVAKLGGQLGAGDDFTQGNNLLRQLSVRGGAGALFSNPTFIDPTGPQPVWFVGQMTRAEAEQHLALGRDGDFVVRESAANGNYVLSMLADGGKMEHHKLFPDAQGRFLLNGDRLKRECRTVQEVVDYLAVQMDGTSVLLNVPEPDTFYGSRPTGEGGETTGDFYGSVQQQGRRTGPAWLHGALAREEAERYLLQNPTPGNFMVRESKARAGTYAVSLVIDDGRIEHHSLRPEHGAFLLNDSPLSAACSTLEDVVTHLQRHAESMSRPLRATNMSGNGISNPGYDAGMLPGATDDGSYQELPINRNAAPVSIAPPRPPKINPGYVESGPPPPLPTKISASFRRPSRSDADAPALPKKMSASFRQPARPPATGAPPVNRQIKPVMPDVDA